MSRRAPAVRLQGSADRRWQHAIRWLAIATIAGTSGWWLLLWQQHSAGLWPRLTVPLLALLGGLATWPRRRRGWSLHWDGAAWHLDGTPCRPRVALDFGRWLLLHLDGRGRHWLALAEDDHRTAWHALRCALYCARPSLPPPPLAGHGAAPTPDER